MRLLPSSTFTLDSINTEIFYVRNIQNVTDSLIINVGVNATAAQASNSSFTANVFFWDNFGDSVVRFKNVPYNSAKNELGAIQSQKRFAIALDSTFLADTTSYGSNIISISTASLPTVISNGVIHLSMSFKPGFTWNANSHTLNNKNFVRYLYYKEQKDNHNTTLRYYRGNASRVDYNRSYFVNTAL
jgi:hypothetical protein